MERAIEHAMIPRSAARTSAPLRVHFTGPAEGRLNDIKASLEWGNFEFSSAEQLDPNDLNRSDGPDLLVIAFQDSRSPVYPICRAARSGGFRGPMLVLASQEDAVEMVLALEGGANAWCGPSWTARAIGSQIGALLRTESAVESPAQDRAPLKLNNWLLNPTTMQCRIDDRRVPLTNQEFRVLWTLATRANTIVPRTELNTALARAGEPPGRRTADAFIARVRKKLGEQHGEHLRTFHAIGYMLANPGNSAA
jgi:two-component system response regulator RstA